jgi:hypothetical protein
MTISGNLRTMPLPDVMQWLANGRHTGTLVVTDGSVEKSLYLKDGVILSCTSSDPKEFLGHYLVSRGVIGETELAEAVAEQDRNGGLLGTILVERGGVSGEELERTLRIKAQESIYGLFRWTGGEFYFIDSVLPDYDIVPISLDVTGLILEGARRVDLWLRILESVPSIDCVPVLSRPLGELRSLSVTPEQGFILSRVDGQIDVRSIVQISPLPEIDALLVLRGLIEAGHLKLEFR